MLATTIRSPPSAEDYVALSEYQSRTPESFCDGKPVLHFHLQDAVAAIPISQCGAIAIFPPETPAETITNGETGQVAKQNVQVFVNSECFTVYSAETTSGVSIPYPAISIHAVKQVFFPESPSTSAVWMQLELSDGGADDEDFDTVELTIIPPNSEDARPLYDAIAACSNLHPDVTNGDGEEDGDECDRIVFEGSAEEDTVEGFTGVLRGAADGGLPPPLPGSGGWITAENVHEYFDEEGNWIQGGNAEEDTAAEDLGQGAGRTRPHVEIGPEAINGDEVSESKRPRVE